MKTCPICGSRVVYTGVFDIECLGAACVNFTKHEPSIEDLFYIFAAEHGIRVLRDSVGFLDLDLPATATPTLIEACVVFIRANKEAIVLEAARWRAAA